MNEILEMLEEIYIFIKYNRQVFTLIFIYVIINLLVNILL